MHGEEIPCANFNTQIMEEIRKAFAKRFQDSFTKEDVFSILDDVQSNSVIESMGFKINGSNYIVEHNGVKTKLPKKQFLLLRMLMFNKNKIMRRHQILNEVWGSDIIVGDRTIDVHIRKIRETLPGNYLITKKTIGYGWFEKD